MNWKEVYTKVFLKEAGIAVSEATLNEYIPVWWQNIRSKDTGGLRLTDAGYEFICEKLNLKTYDIPYPNDFEITTQVLIFLDNLITCPYYMTKKGIIVTDEKKAVELHLFSGDIRKYGLTKAMKRQEKDSKSD